MDETRPAASDDEEDLQDGSALDLQVWVGADCTGAVTNEQPLTPAKRAASAEASVQSAKRQAVTDSPSNGAAGGVSGDLCDAAAEDIEAILDFDEQAPAQQQAEQPGRLPPSSSSGEVTSLSSSSRNPQQLRAAATAKKQVLPEWEVTGDRRWLYARDKSAWFNYGFDHDQFRAWLQQQLDLRLQRQSVHSLRVSDEWASSSHPTSSSTRVELRGDAAVWSWGDSNADKTATQPDAAQPLG